ncbi:MAG TPA: CocE/NonD family hydrolase [Saprospiraceae bacterium]|nr:CocE/NonD family hydrolase [Saprospiraceae bacterium]
MSGFTQEDILSKLSEIAIIEQKVMMPMRDGTRLSTDIYRPKKQAKVPIILSRTPYQFNAYINGDLNTRPLQAALDAVHRGYAYVIQNERGRFYSEGDWDILGVPLTDAEDAFTWLSAQDWSNGKIGLIGCSSTAEWQMAAASLNHPALAAIVPQGYGAGVGRVGRYFEQGNWYRGGAQQMLFTSWLYSTQHDVFKPKLPEGISTDDLLRLQRFYDMAPRYPRVDWAKAFYHLPVKDIIKNVNGPKGIYEEMIVRKPNDPAWYKGGLYHDDMAFHTPAFWFVSWFDVASSPNIALYNHLRENAPEDIAAKQYLVIAPVLHCAFKRATENTMIGELNVGDARLDYDGMINAWFDHFLKGVDNDVLATIPRVQYYTMGKNLWQSSDVWPPNNAVMTPFYLQSEGNANTLLGDGRLSLTPSDRNQSDRYVYDPLDPVPSFGGNVCCTGNAIQGGSYDQSEIETRNDVLVFTTEPLGEGVEVSGYIETVLYASSDVKDTDFTIKLIDVYPDGKAYNLDETIQRARYREGYEKEVWMKEGEIYEIQLTPMSTSNYFAKGHSIRIEISSSNFPRFERNLNTGGNNFDETIPVIATNRIHHGPDYPSKVILPVVR